MNCMLKIKSYGIPFSRKLSSKMQSIRTDWKAQWQAGPGILSITTYFFSTVCHTGLSTRYRLRLDYVVPYLLLMVRVSPQFSGPDSLPLCQHCSKTLIKAAMPWHLFFLFFLLFYLHMGMKSFFRYSTIFGSSTGSVWRLWSAQILW